MTTYRYDCHIGWRNDGHFICEQKKSVYVKNMTKKNSLEQTFLRIHYLFYQTQLWMDTTFRIVLKELTNNYLDEIMQRLGTEQFDTIELVSCLFRRFEKVPLTDYTVQKYTQSTLGQIVLTCFVLGFFRLWFDGGYNKKVCQVKMLKIKVFQDKNCMNLKRHREELVTEMSLLYFLLTQNINVNVASLVTLSPKLRDFLEKI